MKKGLHFILTSVLFSCVIFFPLFFIELIQDYKIIVEVREVDSTKTQTPLNYESDTTVAYSDDDDTGSGPIFIEDNSSGDEFFGH